MGSPAYVEDWLQRRLAKAAALAQQLGAAPGLVKADLPAVQAFSQLARQCFAQQQAHLARGLWGPPVRAFLAAVDDHTAQAFAAVNSLPGLEAWQRQLLFEPVNAGGFGLPALAAQHPAAFLGGAAASAADVGDARPVPQQLLVDAASAEEEFVEASGTDLGAVLGV